MKILKDVRLQVIVILILTGALSRLFLHPANFTALVATGLFGGFYLKNFKQAALTVFSAMFLSDSLIGFHALVPIVYLALLMPIALGKLAQRSAPLPWLISGALASSLSFFAITNFAVWCFTALYPKTLEGFILCFEAAIPFFTNQLAGDLFYTGVIFGIFLICQIALPNLKISKNAI